MKKFIQLQNTYKTKKGDIWINHSPKDSDIYVHLDTQLLETERTLLENPDWFQLVEDKLDLRSLEAEKMREESRATRFEFVPKNGEVAYYYDHGRRLVFEINYSGGFLMDWHNGFIKRTERECKTHAEKYARYFLTE